MKLLVINGSNINMLGIREPEIYGEKSYQDLCNMINKYAEGKKIDVKIYQSNHEGAIVDCIQKAYFDKVDGIIINPGAYTHTSIAILDALKAVAIKTVEVHLSKIDSREDFRKFSYISLVANKTIIGHGLNGYLEAIDWFIDLASEGEPNDCKNK
ncbi:MAG: 3-dehydroquinate dehydratase [Staphylococcus sp.]|jgi:dehydroquinase class II|nr:3-dehydroquinate dehydratase [Staphylococcus sp.]